MLLVISLLLVGVGPAAAEKSVTRYDDPELVATVEGTNVVEPGETTTVRLSVQNRGSYVGKSYGNPTLRESEVSAESPGAAVSTTADVTRGDAPVEVKSGEQTVGTLGRDSTATVDVKIEVDDGASPGVYRLPVRFEYDYVSYLKVETAGSGNSYESVRSTETETEYVEVRVDTRFDPEVVDAEGSGLNVGEDGSVAVTLRNDGHETATDAEVELVPSGTFTSDVDSRYVGDLGRGETATARFRVSVNEKAVAGDYPVQVRVKYEDLNGVSRTSEVETGHVAVGDEASFDVSAQPEALYVDSMGGVSVNVTNTGEEVRNARVVLHESPPFVPLSASSSLGDLGHGETATTRFRVEVSDRAVAQNYPLDFHVEYLNAFDETTRSDTITSNVAVGSERTFSVVGTPNVTAGSTEEVEFRFRNTGGGTMADAVARVNVDTPFSTDDDTAYLGDLEPGETATATFRVSVEGSATPKEYTVDAEVKYENPFGEKVVTDIEKAPVRVTGGGGGILGFIAELIGL